jgi:tripartite-type tricarboxylate transporter receptor subunit TctC
VPLITDLAQNDEQRQELKLIFARQVMGRPYLAPPGIPKDRAETLRRAFMDTMNDPEFLADAERAKLEIRPIPGEELEKLVNDLAKTPADVAKRAAELIR